MMINTIEEAIGRLRYVQLDTEYPPTEILHMILAGGPSQVIYNVGTGRFQPALEFLCTETRKIQNYPIPGGIVKEDPLGRVYFSKGSASFKANEHLNEFLGVFAAAGVNFKSSRVVSDHGNEFTLVDVAEHAARMFKESEDEPSWSLMAFSIHPGISIEWENEAGQMLSVSKILESACKIPYGQGKCFGTHVLEGIAFAVSRYCLERDLEPSQLDGIWFQAYEYVKGAIMLIKKNQKEDGSIDRCWFREKRLPRKLNEWKEKFKDLAAVRYTPAKAIVYPTGHCLDALSSFSLFLTSDRDWINNACYIVAQTIENQWLQLAREINAVAHAIHALKTLGE
jgi:hypothetical protein